MCNMTFLTRCPNILFVALLHRYVVPQKGESKQTQMPYFESGWVSDEDMEKERKRQEGGGGGFKFPWQ